MSVAVIGGIDRLRRLYEKKGLEFGFKVKVFSQKAPGIRKRLNGVKGLVLFTDTVSHRLVKEALMVARKQGIPVERSHSSSLNGLHRSLQGLSYDLITRN